MRPGTKIDAVMALALWLSACGSAAPDGPADPRDPAPPAASGHEEVARGDGVAGGHDEGGQALPDGAADFLTGGRIRGTVVDGADISPLVGFSVVEHGVQTPAPPIVTGADGVFLVELRDEATPALRVTREGWVPTVMLTSAEGRLYFGGEFKIEMFRSADEAAIDMEELGHARAPGTGQVLVNFQPLGSGGGARAVLQAPGVQAHRYDAADKLVPGDRLGEDPFAGEIVYPEVPPGTWPVVVTSPAGLDCRGPDVVPAEAGTYTRAYVYCRPPADWEAPPPKR